MNQGYDKKRVYTSIDNLVMDAAKYVTVSNLGGDPEKMRLDDMYEGGEVEVMLNDELNAWLRVMRSASKDLVKLVLPFTIEELDKLSQKKEHHKRYME